MAENYLFDGLLGDKLSSPERRDALFATLPDDGRHFTYGDIEKVSGRFANEQILFAGKHYTITYTATTVTVTAE